MHLKLDRFSGYWRKSPSTIIGLIGISVFAINILIGKYRHMTGTGTASPLDGMPEFILLTISIVFFVISMIASEKQEKAEQEET